MGMMDTALEIGRVRRQAMAGQCARRRYSAAMAALDRAIARLEELNLQDRGQYPPNRSAQAAIDHAVALLPSVAKSMVRDWQTVQQALEGMFDVQEVVQAERLR